MKRIIHETDNMSTIIISTFIILLTTHTLYLCNSNLFNLPNYMLNTSLLTRLKQF